MKTFIACITLALLTACTTTPGGYPITSPEGGHWKANTDGTWTDTLGRTTDIDPRIPLCSSATLKKDVKQCVVKR